MGRRVESWTRVDTVWTIVDYIGRSAGFAVCILLESASRLKMITLPQSQVWNTDVIDSKEKFSYWNDALCSSIMKMDLDRRSSGSFNAELRLHQFGDIHFNHVRADEHVARLNRSGISRIQEHYFYLLVQKSGMLVGSQHGIENVLMPGDLIN